ncbi:MAG: serine/threonine-protein phosphatase [Planctomycetes bacterium]|nr:serine/threonine-protein phosphatase [Planctomycetota bacterium]
MIGETTESSFIMGNVELVARTDVGCIRTANQDEFVVARAGTGRLEVGTAVQVLPEDGLVLAVADGMGGMPDGDLASKLAVRAVHETVRELRGQLETSEACDDLLKSIVSESHQRIVEANAGREQHLMMGTTITICTFFAGHVVVGNVGDSRTYLIHEGEARPLTTDQTLANLLAQYGHITYAEAEEHPDRKILAQALGHGQEIEMQLTTHAVASGDWLLLCSDGLTDLLEREELSDLFQQQGQAGLGALADLLVDSAKSRGGHDNITLILARIP